MVGLRILLGAVGESTLDKSFRRPFHTRDVRRFDALDVLPLCRGQIGWSVL